MPLHTTAVAGAAVAAVALAALLLWPSGEQGTATAGAPAPGSRPSILLITTDDQPLSTFSRRVMPATFREIAGPGVEFTNAIAAPPLCCPFRAGVISGQYDHNNGVTRNHPGYSQLRHPELVLPAFLQEVGYRTGFVGKYLNGTTAALGTDPAPGWDSWEALYGNHRYWGTTITADGRGRQLPEGRSTTRALNRRALSFIREASGDQPFFLWLAHFAPHPDRLGSGPCSGARIAKARAADLRRLGEPSMPPSPSLRERNRSDKVPEVRRRPSLGPAELKQQMHAWRCSAAAVQQVDEGVEQLIAELRSTGLLASTIVIFGSDNGFSYGHHGLVGKYGVYEEMLRVPLAIRLPGDRPARPSAEMDELVSQVDLAPTLLDWAAAKPCVDGSCRRLDGRSLVGLLAGEQDNWPPDRALPIRIGDCRIRAMRTSSTLFARYLQPRPDCDQSGEEYYDLARDPHQLHGEVDVGPIAYRRLRERLYDLQHCSGIRGRNTRPRGKSAFCE